MTDADTAANSDLLWKLVHLVQDTIDKDGDPQKPLADLRKLADEIDPDNGKY